MQRDARFAQAWDDRVVHLVGRVTDEVFSFLGPATRALAGSGLQQFLVMIDDPQDRRHIVPLGEWAELVLVSQLRNPVAQWQAMSRALLGAIAGREPHAVHLHGLLPCIQGAWVLRRAGLESPIYFSPHGSRSLRVLCKAGGAALFVLRGVLPSSRQSAIVNVAGETQSVRAWRSVELVESPVAPVYVQAQRQEARQPLIVTGGHGQTARSAERVAQLAVLLSGAEIPVAFNWLGEVDEVSRRHLTAANVGVFASPGDAELAMRLSAGWIYLAPAGSRGFPLSLVNAMAAGLACVAIDCAQHREVLQHGQTGFLCGHEREFIDRIALLIDSPELRQRIGSAARHEAARRFDVSNFERSLLAAYAKPPGHAFLAVERLEQGGDR